MEEIKITDLLKALRKNIIFIILTGVVLALIVFVYSGFIKTPLYKTSTTLILSNSEDDKAITQSDISLNQQLVSTYGELIKSKRVLDQVISDLDLEDSVDDLSKNISVESVQNTAIIKISVENETPTMAKDIANDIATIFSKEVINIYKINNVEIIDKATVPKNVSNNTTKRDTSYAFIIGIIISTIIVFIKYYFDDTIKLSDSIEEEVKMPLIGKISKNNSKKGNGEVSELIVNKDPKSLISESFKSIRTNLSFASVDKEIKSILITSSIPGEGKSFVSANLAIAFCQTGKKVLLVDCDMRKGRQHEIFGVLNTKGLSNLLLDDYEKVYKSYINTTNVKNLSLLTRGVVPPNPSELLNSNRNRSLIKLLTSAYDLVIFDGVPCNGLSDSVVMSTLVDNTIIIASEGVTPKSLLDNTKKTFDNVNANVSGIILNKVNMKDSEYYNKYYSYYEDEKND